jgi:hypothetical protein
MIEGSCSEQGTNQRLTSLMELGRAFVLTHCEKWGLARIQVLLKFLSDEIEALPFCFLVGFEATTQFCSSNENSTEHPHK